MGVDVFIGDHIGRITLNRPDALNALDLPALDALDAAWRRLDADPDVRVLLITGAGERSFSVGADLKRFNPEGQPIELRHPAFFPATDKPIVAAVNGYCLAGGCELLGATDVRIAAEHAEFSLTEARIGLFPAGGSAVRFPRQLPWPLAMELLFGARTVSAARALAWGLVNQVVPAPELMTVAEAVAREVAQLAPLSVQAIKACARATWSLPEERAFELQDQYTRRAVDSEDAREGPRAFLEKRPPRFQGK